LSLLASASFMRLSLMKAAHADVGGAPCRKSGYVGRKRWAQPDDRFYRIDNESKPETAATRKPCFARPQAEPDNAHKKAQDKSWAFYPYD